MGDEKANTARGEEEPKIPVFTVLKNGAILKNIFIVNKPPPPPSVHQETETEEILIVGRHPDCHIVLTHPSVSRFHLQILSNPASHKLSLTDLSSVHGTWISEKRIEPGVRVELRQGDTLRVGASSRLYRLHWIPLSHAYQQEALRVLNCSPFDKAEADLEALFSDENMGLIEEKQPNQGEECRGNSSKDDCQGKDMYETPAVDQVVNVAPIEDADFESTRSVSEVIESLVCDNNLGFITKKEIPSAPPMHTEEEDEDQSECVAGLETQLSSFWAFGTESVNLFYPLEDSASNSTENQCVQLHCMTGGSELDNKPENSVFNENGDDYPIVQVLEEDQGQSDISGLSAGPFVIESPSLLIREVLGETRFQQVVEENLTPEIKSDLLGDVNGKSSIKKDHGQTDQLCLSVALKYSDDKEEDAYSGAQLPERTADQCSWIRDHGQTDNDLCLPAGPSVMKKSSLLVEEVLEEINNQPGEEENSAQQPTLVVNLDMEISNEVRCIVDERHREAENRSMLIKNHHEKLDTKTISSVPVITDSVDSFSPDEVLTEIIDDRENQNPQSLCTTGGHPESEFSLSPPLRSDDKSIFGESIWTRRGKPACAVLIQTGKRRERTTGEAIIDNQDVEIFTPDKENLTPNTFRMRSLKKKNEVELELDDTQEEEIFTPDKENFTPNTLRLRSLNKKGKLELTNSKSHRSSLSKQNLNFDIPRENLLVSTGEENQRLKVLQERKSVELTTRNQATLGKGVMITKLGTERMPFQSLLESSGSKNLRSEASVSNVGTESSTSLACSRTKEVSNPLSYKYVEEVKRGWTMVADTNTLLHKESRKLLQLLQGLKGTHLIIPRMVIRELDCLKQRGSLFRKKPEACLVLEWMEKCMEKTNWWIHVQSSLEDGRLIAPTPPATPQSPYSGNSWGLASGTTNSFSFLRCRSSLELVSPAAEDHILDCALLNRKMSNEGNLVLLSNDIALKIKAMAEGLLCETAEEFHESLVNPSSERFMWAGSCPRGRTWSYLADMVLAEKYNRCQPKKSSKGGGAKGLKLILLHNSHYGHIH